MNADVATPAPMTEIAIYDEVYSVREIHPDMWEIQVQDSVGSRSLGLHAHQGEAVRTMRERVHARVARGHEPKLAFRSSGQAWGCDLEVYDHRDGCGLVLLSRRGSEHEIIMDDPEVIRREFARRVEAGLLTL